MSNDAKDSLNPNLLTDTAMGFRVTGVLLFCALTITEAILYCNIGYSSHMLGTMLILGFGLGILSVYFLAMGFGLSYHISCRWRKREDNNNWPRVIEYLADQVIAGDAAAIELLPLIKQELKLPDEKIRRLKNVHLEKGIVLPQLELISDQNRYSR